MASYALSRSSSVQRPFFCGDVIEITSWAPDVHVVNLVCPFLIYRRGIFFRCEFQSSKFIHDMDPPGHGHHACTNSTQNTLKWLDEQNNGLFGVLLSLVGTKEATLPADTRYDSSRVLTLCHVCPSSSTTQHSPELRHQLAVLSATEAKGATLPTVTAEYST